MTLATLLSRRVVVTATADAGDSAVEETAA